MYVPGGIALILLIFSVLMMFGVIPFTHVTVGGLFVLVCLGFAGPYFVRTA